MMISHNHRQPNSGQTLDIPTRAREKSDVPHQVRAEGEPDDQDLHTTAPELRQSTGAADVAIRAQQRGPEDYAWNVGSSSTNK
jgi:hypothetical protein